MMCDERCAASVISRLMCASRSAVRSAGVMEEVLEAFGPSNLAGDIHAVNTAFGGAVEVTDSEAADEEVAGGGVNDSAEGGGLGAVDPRDGELRRTKLADAEVGPTVD